MKLHKIFAYILTLGLIGCMVTGYKSKKAK